jgi:hypothetical protein
MVLTSEAMLEITAIKFCSLFTILLCFPENEFGLDSLIPFQIFNSKYE